ncbi:hypothetical protein DP73_14470 [Desulfosporosinus sp. HMP52]|uniref:DUF2812 domain-containing protein n=1 Tax=Desulfosporosinus sp. HMP52 TaxID=1487923 RepID=UPI00051FBCE1|nr:DUF2812 domain-containing protein [Desulfosporosinus sp. HMP52]KGK87283.1 hypothetical protein DP73_14470 [Desulfosporosinus sp. HMP52]
MKYRTFKFFVDFEKEEKWLNQMAAKGYNFIDFSLPGRYLFETGNPGEYIYRIELLKHLPNSPESKDYIEFLEDTGGELVSSHFRWAWFRRKSADGPFHLFTDYSSQIKHYQRIIWFIGIVGIINLVIGFYNLCYGLLLTGPDYGFFFNAYLAPISFLIAFFCLKVTTSYYFNLKKLQKESQIHE